MSDSLRILTYNTQLRSYGMEAFAQWSPLPYSSTEERAETIAQRILRSAQDYDVVCLNEVFDEDARDVLYERLSPRYASIVRKAQASELELRHAVPAPFDRLVAASKEWCKGIGFDADRIFEETGPKLEDSGLMLFSRLPFAEMSPTSEEFLLALGPAFRDIPSVPVVLFCPFHESDFDDSLAAKGVIYARLMRGAKPFHLLMSHTQADSAGHQMEHRDTRVKQFEVVREAIQAMVGDPPYDEEVLFCGDFNVNGLALGGTKANAEAIELLADEFSFWRRHLDDAWWWGQCQGKPAVANHMPVNCDPGMTAPSQRLDYFLRANFPRRLVAQHVAVAWDVAQAGPSEAPTKYTSDHLPLRIDLNDHRRPHASANTAKVLQPRPGHDADTGPRLLQEGQMDWFCLLENGSYGIGLFEGEGRVSVELYTADNLSRPAPPFTTTPEQIGDLALTRYTLPRAPVFIRVSLVDRHDELSYHLLVHRYDGTGPEDAIGLLRGVPLEFDMKVGAPHGLEHPDPDFDDRDCAWFTAALDEPAIGQDAVRHTIRIDQTDFIPGTGDHGFGLIAAARRPGGAIAQVAQDGGGLEPVTLSFRHEGGARLFVLVNRVDPSFQASHFRIVLTSEQSYLYGNPAKAGQGFDRATLFCLDETDGFLGQECGSDDIAINITASEELVFHMDNDDFLEFDDDTIRDLPIDLVRYQGDATFELVELDDLSPADRASETIPSFEGVRELPQDRKLIANGSWVQAKFPIDFGDGKYELTIVVSREPPPGP